jgi:hypothetical protein
MNPSKLLKNAVVFFLFLGLLWIIHRVNQKRQSQALAEIWLNPKGNSTQGFRMDFRSNFQEDVFFDSLMVRILRHRDSVILIELQAEDSVLVRDKISKNQRFIIHP